jgi:hypothetical protein
MTNPAVDSVWVAKDGRVMRVIRVVGRFVQLEVLNATGRMRRQTQMDISNFGDFLVPRFIES